MKNNSKAEQKLHKDRQKTQQLTDTPQPYKTKILISGIHQQQETLKMGNSKVEKQIRTAQTFLNDQRKTIGIVNLSLEKSLNLLRIKEWISSYLGIKTQILDLQLALYYENNNFYINYPKQQKEYQLEKNTNDIINAMSILHVLISILPKNICSLVAIMDQDIFDPSQPDKYIVGRACGNRVCVVQYSEDQEEFYGTIVHELLHTFGLGHCKSGSCIMNRNISESLQLCPVDLEKLKGICLFDDLQRYQKIFKVAKQIGLSKECEWLKQMIDIIQHTRV